MQNKNHKNCKFVEIKRMKIDMFHKVAEELKNVQVHTFVQKHHSETVKMCEMSTYIHRDKKT